MMVFLTPVFAPAAMHIPDGFLSLQVLVPCWMLTILFVALALKETAQHLDDRQVPFVGVLAAMVFAAQMLNFPIVGGTSGHLIGGTLVAILLGPWTAILVMTSVVTLQALVFMDGGLLALGANLLTMAVISPWVGYGLYTLLKKIHSRAAAFVAAWASVVTSATIVSFALWLSGTVSLPIVLRAMVGVHALIGIGEGLITVAMLAFLERVMPAYAPEREGDLSSVWARGWRVGLVAAFLLALLSPLASPWPDGLERVAADTGFIGRARGPFYHLLTNYSVPWVTNPVLSTVLAGLVGTLLVFLVAYVTVRLIHRQRQAHSS